MHFVQFRFSLVGFVWNFLFRVKTNLHQQQLNRKTEIVNVDYLPLVFVV